MTVAIIEGLNEGAAQLALNVPARRELVGIAQRHPSTKEVAFGIGGISRIGTELVVASNKVEPDEEATIVRTLRPVADPRLDEGMLRMVHIVKLEALVST